MKTYEIHLKNKEGTLEKRMWVHRKWYKSMYWVIEEAIKGGEEEGKLVVSIKRID